MVHIYSGPIQSGKTTRISNWLKNRPEADGILAPIRHGKRHLQRIINGESRCLQPPQNPADSLAIGRFLFSRATFKWGREQLYNIKPLTPWVIIDEIGKLELQGEGLEPAVSFLLDSNPARNIILVVRDSLLEQAIGHYKLGRQNFRMIDL